MVTVYANPVTVTVVVRGRVGVGGEGLSAAAEVSHLSELIELRM